MAHLGRHSADTVTVLLQRALTADPTSPTVYCTSLIDCGYRMGLTLHQAPKVDLPEAVLSFIQRVTAPHPRRIYTDGSFAIAAPLLDTLSTGSRD